VRAKHLEQEFGALEKGAEIDADEDIEVEVEKGRTT
jgi:hypothetical protein